jgi:phosphoglucomutase
MAATHYQDVNLWGIVSNVSCVMQVIDSVEDYLKLLKSIYDFGALGRLLARPDFKFVFDGMHGVAGPYAQRIFVQVSSTPVLHCESQIFRGSTDVTWTSVCRFFGV